VQVFGQSQRNICSSTDAHNVGLCKLGTKALITSSFRFTPAGIKNILPASVSLLCVLAGVVTAHSARVSKYKTLAHIRLLARQIRFSLY
jgi:hypothetical protein